MGKKFDLAGLLEKQKAMQNEGSAGVPAGGPRPRSVSDPDTGKQQIRYIPLELIDPDPDNFYTMDGLEELAGSIEMLGLQQPLLVRPGENGHYITISGHRRRAAIQLISDGGSGQFAGGVPCIVDESPASDALRELKLIMANADTRKMNSADQGKQAERIEDLLRQLVDEGYEFPGRLRDWVAELSGLSRTKLARLKVIREKLEKSIRKAYYDKGTLGESSAYALARLPEDAQRRIVDWYRARNSGGSDKNGLRYLYENTIESYGKDLTRVQALTCPEKLGGGECLNRAGILEHLWRGSYRAYGGSCAAKSCCFTCGELATCKNVCPKMAEKAKAEKAKRREASRAEKEAREQEEAAPKEWVRNVWQRFGSALTRAGLEEKNLESIRKIWQIPSDEVKALEAGKSKKIRADMCLPFSNASYRHDFEKLIALADRLDVSIDYLLCRSDDPGRGGVAAAGMEGAAGTAWHWGKDGLPINRPLLTYSKTNLGDWYRAAIWTGSVFVDPSNPKKELTGLLFTRWAEIPEEGRSFPPAAQGAGEPAEPYWRPFPMVKPPKGQRAFVQQESSGPGYFTEARLAKWDGNAWTWASSDAGIAEIEATRVIWWFPEPAYPAEAEDGEDEENDG